MKLKILCIAIAFISFSEINAQQKKAEKASVILNRAFTKAAKENKNVMLIFHASWCGWCKRMDKNMAKESVKDYFNTNYVTSHLTVMESKGKEHLENEGAMDILKKLKAEKTGIPFWIVYNSKGEILKVSRDTKGNNLGCPATKEEVNVFIDILDKTSKMSAKDKEAVTKAFLIKK
ncbi:MAG: thioredoxin family protein [Flavobacteriaceae bacterium]|nr:thioredoxin family protein [Flavobacteriaceae bacterium]